jgi:CSLREA domain-containing protein
MRPQRPLATVARVQRALTLPSAVADCRRWALSTGRDTNVQRDAHNRESRVRVLAAHAVRSVDIGRRRIVLLAFLAGSLVAAAPARAGVIQVTTRADETSAGDGSCSLREAISAVDSPQAGGDCSVAGGGSDTISLGPGTYVLSLPGPREDSNATGDLDVTGTVRNLTIEGAGAGVTTIDATQLGDRVMDIDSGATTTIRDLTISGGRAPAGTPGGAGMPGAKGDSGGAIRNLGSLSLTGVVVANNQAGDGGGHPDPLNGPAGPGGPGGDGGGLYNAGTLTLTDSELIYNGAGAGAPGAGLGYDGGAGGAGGGIYNAGTLTITRSTVGADSAGTGGPGAAGTTAGNGNAGGWGGGVFGAAFSSLTATNSTLSSNLAGDGGVGGNTSGPGNGGNGASGGDGGGLALAIGAFASLEEVTLTDNARGVGGAGGLVFGGTGSRGADGQAGSGGGVFDQSGLCTNCTRLQGSIVARNAGANCSGAITDGGHNLVFGDATCPGVDADPQLEPLAPNGGPTQTLALGVGSAAIDLVPPGAGCPPTDQRGVARPQGVGCDAGAYELAPPAISGAHAGASGLAGAAISASVNANLQDTSVLVRYGRTTDYGSTTASQDVGAGNTPALVTIPLAGLAPGSTYHTELVATNPDGTTRSGDLTFTTSSAGAGGGTLGAGSSGGSHSGANGGQLLPPTLSHVHQSASRWVEGTASTRIGARRKLPVASTISFKLNETATVSFAFTQTVRGRKTNRRCVPQTNHNPHKPACPRAVIRGAFSFGAHGGLNRVRFDGRLPRGRRLMPGRYTLVITATDANRQRSTPRRLTFTIVRSTE